MTPQEIIQAKVLAIQSAGPNGSMETIKERFEFLIEDALAEAYNTGKEIAQAQMDSTAKMVAVANAIGALGE